MKRNTAGTEAILVKLRKPNSILKSTERLLSSPLLNTYCCKFTHGITNSPYISVSIVHALPSIVLLIGEGPVVFTINNQFGSKFRNFN